MCLYNLWFLALVVALCLESDSAGSSVFVFALPPHYEWNHHFCCCFCYVHSSMFTILPVFACIGSLHLPSVPPVHSPPSAFLSSSSEQSNFSNLSYSYAICAAFDHLTKGHDYKRQEFPSIP
jgi:hypothetical protein